MRSRIAGAATVLAILASMPDRAGHFTGKAAHNADEPTLRRIQSRFERDRFGGRNMSLGELIAWSGRKARQRTTHPGKRGKRARA